MTTVVLRRRAQRDIAAAARWYEGERAGLARQYLAAVGTLLARIGEAPQQFPTVDGGVRRGLVPRFPCGVYFAQHEEQVTVLAVLHLHRAPDAWRSRDEGTV